MPLLTEEIDAEFAKLADCDCTPELIYLTESGQKRLIDEITPQGLTLQVTHYKGTPIQRVAGGRPEFFVTGKPKPDPVGDPA